MLIHDQYYESIWWMNISVGSLLRQGGSNKSTCLNMMANPALCEVKNSLQTFILKAQTWFLIQMSRYIIYLFIYRYLRTYCFQEFAHTHTHHLVKVAGQRVRSRFCKVPDCPWALGFCSLGGGAWSKKF